MKHLQKSIFSLALASLLSLASCTSDELLPGAASDNANPVHLTLTVNRGDAKTRTTLEENNQNGGLISKWVKEDILYVYDKSGDNVGKLAMDSGWETPVGVFSGTLKGVKDGDFVSLFYYNLIEGMVSEVENSNSKHLMIDLSEQSFSSVSDLAQLDILTSADPSEENLNDEATVQLSVNADKNTATVKRDVTLKSKLAFARFTLNNLPTGANGTLYITDVDDNLYVKHGLAFANGRRVYDEKSAQGIKISDVGEGNDIFVALVPNYTVGGNVKEYTLKFKFVNDGEGKDGSVYTYQFENPTTIEAGKYYCAFDKADGLGEDDPGTIGGIRIDMNKEQVATRYKITFENSKGDYGGDLTADIETPEKSFVLPKVDADINGIYKNVKDIDDFNDFNFVGWKKKGSDDNTVVKDIWTLTSDDPEVTLVPVALLKGQTYTWNIEWRSGYGDNTTVNTNGADKSYTGTIGDHQGNADPTKQLLIPTQNPSREGNGYSYLFWGWKYMSPTTASGNNSTYGNLVCDWMKSSPDKTQPIRFNAKNYPTVVLEAAWGLERQVVYHFNANKTTAASIAPYNALHDALGYDHWIEDNNYKTWIECDYPLRDPRNTRDTFFTSGDVGFKTPEGKIFVGWKQLSGVYELNDDYMSADDVDHGKEIISRDNIGNLYWPFKDGKRSLHLVPIFEDDPNYTPKTNVSASGYPNGEI